MEVHMFVVREKPKRLDYTWDGHAKDDAPAQQMHDMIKLANEVIKDISFKVRERIDGEYDYAPFINWSGKLITYDLIAIRSTGEEIVLCEGRQSGRITSRLVGMIDLYDLS
jgi:hypothetical protein